MAPAAGGLAGALAFDPFGLAFLIPLFPLGIFIGMRTAPRPGSAFVRVFAGAFVYYMIAISWLLTLGRYYPIVMGGIVIAALYLALYPALSAYVLRRWFGGLPPLLHFAAFGALWVIAEWLRTLGELAVPMVQVGHAWAPWPRFVQLAEFFGEAGLNVQVLVFSAGIFALVQGFAARWKRSPAPASLQADAPDMILGDFRPGASRATAALGLLGLGVLLLVFSLYRYSLWTGRLEAEAGEAKLRVALVQPNISQDEKIRSVAAEDEDVRMRLIEEHTRVLEKLVEREVDSSVDLVIFPESAYTDLLFSVFSENRDRVRRMMAPSGADLLTGGTRVGLNEAGTRIEKVWNSAWFIPGDRGAWESYDKIRLVPFGETLSFFRYLPLIGTLVSVGEFEPGAEMSVFHAEGVPFSTIICFESYFGSQTRKAVRNGAEFLVLITNDGWYRRSAGPDQHHAQSILRVIETRRPLLRCAYTGITSILDPAGRRVAGLDLEKRGVVHGEVRPRTDTTFFVRWGNVWVMSAMTVVLTALAIVALRQRGPAA